MELIIGPDVFVGELHDVCKEFAEGRQVHSNLQSHDGRGSLARKVVVKFVIVVLTVAASLKGINGLRPITSSTVFRRGIERRTRMHSGGGRREASFDEKKIRHMAGSDAFPRHVLFAGNREFPWI